MFLGRFSPKIFSGTTRIINFDLNRFWANNTSLRQVRATILKERYPLGVFQYQRKKEQLIGEEQRYKQLIDDTHHRAKTWLNNAEQLFSFAETAKERFESGNLVVKREVVFGTRLEPVC